MGTSTARRPPRLVVLRALGLGDLLAGVPALRGLRRAVPDHELVLLCPRELEPLARLAGVADRVVDTDFRTQPPRAEDMAAAVREPAVAVNLHGRGPESHAALASLRPGCMIAYAEPRAGVRGPLWADDAHEIDRWCDLLAWHGIAADPADLRIEIAPARPALPGGGRCIVLHPGASSAARRWPADRWVQVARALRVLGHPVVITGSAAERQLACDIARGAGLADDHVLAGRTSVLELAGLVAGACAVVSGDSGPAHLATAAGTRSVVLFGPTPPARWGPRVDHHRHVALWRGATGDPAGSEPHPGLLEISPSDVLAALRAAGP